MGRKIWIFGFLLFFTKSAGAFVAVQSASADLKAESKPVPVSIAFDPVTAYKTRTIQGFTVHINQRALTHTAETADAIKLLTVKLAEIVRMVPPKPLKLLRQTHFWLEWDKKAAGAAEYHVSEQWLRENGYNPIKAHGIEISNVHNFIAWTKQNQPMMALHELSHAYNYLLSESDQAEVERCYHKAMDNGLYQDVDYFDGKSFRRLKAYAATNASEYFAELSEAYFGENDYFPFTWKDLKAYDLDGWQLLRRVWGDPRSRHHPILTAEYKRRK